MNINMLYKNAQLPPAPLPPAPLPPALKEQNAIPRYLSNISVDSLLDMTGRRKNDTPGDGYNNCGFNSILEQVGDHTHTHEMINLLRRILGYGDESSSQMFDSFSSPLVANFFGRPVAEIVHKDGKTAALHFSIPGIDLCIQLGDELDLSLNLVQWCKNREWGQKITGLYKWYRDNLSNTIRFNKATLYDIMMLLLKHPKTIALVSTYEGGHFDAAPHNALLPEGNITPLLQKS
ncbi:MAG: hypothetical protein LBB16_01465 [Puniceicoccales bacterium]|jgi:hypothetical protein|nr:hypothetical protein [Puniceicoccales bacterium]